MTYQRTIPPTSERDAEQEPEDQRLFHEPPAPAYPHLTISTHVIDPDGFVWSVTFTDTPLAAAAAVLQKRGCRPVAPLPPGSSSPSIAPAVAGPPLCPAHQKAMKPMQHADKHGRTHWCTQKVGDDYCQERA